MRPAGPSGDESVRSDPVAFHSRRTLTRRGQLPQDARSVPFFHASCSAGSAPDGRRDAGETPSSSAPAGRNRGAFPGSCIRHLLRIGPTRPRPRLYGASPRVPSRSGPAALPLKASAPVLRFLRDGGKAPLLSLQTGTILYTSARSCGTFSLTAPQEICVSSGLAGVLGSGATDEQSVRRRRRTNVSTRTQTEN